jgi:uncharacterized protein (TIGR03067 family)
MVWFVLAAAFSDCFIEASLSPSRWLETGVYDAQAAIQGEWEVVSYKHLAPLGGCIYSREGKVRITGRRLILVRADADPTEWTIQLDASSSPWSIDIHRNGSVRVDPGVCRLAGEKLMIRIETAERVRPAKVEKDGRGLSCIYLVLKRRNVLQSDTTRSSAGRGGAKTADPSQPR